MPAFQDPIKLGRPRKELSFTADVDELGQIGQSIASSERTVRNAAGELFKRTFRKQMADFRVRPTFPTTDTLKNQLEGLKLIADEPLSFFFADDWPIIADRYTLDTPTTFKLSTSPYTRLGKAYKDAGGTDTDIINISKVFDTYKFDGEPGGTDHFAGGSYDAVTRIVTLGSPPPGGIGSAIFANWTYKGALVNLRPFQPQNRGGNVSAGSPLWAVSLRLDGI